MPIYALITLSGTSQANLAETLRSLAVVIEHMDGQTRVPLIVTNSLGAAVGTCHIGTHPMDPRRR